MVIKDLSEVLRKCSNMDDTLLKDFRTLIISLVLICLFFEPETAVNLCAVGWGIFFVVRYLR